MIGSATIESLPEWAHDLSWVEDAYRTDDGRQRIKQITDAVFLPEIEHPILKEKGFEIIRRGIQMTSPLAIDLLNFWRKCGFGVTDQKIRVEEYTITRYSINCSLDNVQSSLTDTIVFRVILEIARLDTLIENLRIRLLPKLGELEDLLFTNSNLVSLSIDTSRLPVIDICKLFLAVARNTSLQKFHLWRQSNNCSSPSVDSSSQEEIESIETSVSTMLEQNQSLKSLFFDYHTFETDSQKRAFFIGLCSISKNRSVQKFVITPISDRKIDLVPLDDFLKSLSFNFSVQKLILKIRLAPSQIIFFLNNLKLNRRCNIINSLSITPELSSPKEEQNQEISTLFNELARVRVINSLNFDGSAMPRSFQYKSMNYFLNLASNNPFLVELIYKPWLDGSLINSAIEKKLKEGKSIHPTMMYTLIDWV